jgi:hypothetical protein
MLRLSQRLRGLARRIRLEASSEDDPLPVAFSRTHDAPATMADKKRTSGARQLAPSSRHQPVAHDRAWGQSKRALGAVSRQHSSTAGSMGAPPPRTLRPSARETRDTSQHVAAGTTAKVMGEGIEQV